MKFETEQSIILKQGDKSYKVVSNPRVLDTVDAVCPACKCPQRCHIEVKVEHAGAFTYGEYLGCPACGDRTDFAIRKEGS